MLSWASRANFTMVGSRFHRGFYIALPHSSKRGFPFCHSVYHKRDARDGHWGAFRALNVEKTCIADDIAAASIVESEVAVPFIAGVYSSRSLRKTDLKGLPGADLFLSAVSVALVGANCCGGLTMPGRPNQNPGSLSPQKGKTDDGCFLSSGFRGVAIASTGLLKKEVNRASIAAAVSGVPDVT